MDSPDPPEINKNVVLRDASAGPLSYRWCAGFCVGHQCCLDGPDPDELLRGRPNALVLCQSGYAFGGTFGGNPSTDGVGGTGGLEVLLTRRNQGRYGQRGYQIYRC